MPPHLWSPRFGRVRRFVRLSHRDGIVSTAQALGCVARDAQRPIARPRRRLGAAWPRVRSDGASFRQEARRLLASPIAGLREREMIEQLGTWVDDERPVLADHSAAIGGAPPQSIVGAWLIASSTIQRRGGGCAYSGIEPNAAEEHIVLTPAACSDPKVP